jgi:S1/P1 Nuclease
MKRKFLSILIILTASISLVFAWGSWGHEHINRAAVFALPDEMRTFFYNHIDFITEEAGVPDLRKYTINDKAEFARHYINFESFGDDAIDSLPRTMKEIKLKYPDSVLQKFGILPWYIQEMEEKLTKAFKDKRKTEILFLAADLGHYIGDAHMPLHTALNHDGQFTNQKGIHALWESQLPELFGLTYNLYTGSAKYIDDITKETWKLMASTHKLADTLLSTERKLKSEFPKDKVYQLDSAGNIMKNKFNQPIHSYAYAKKYHELLNGMVEQQLRGAIAETANFWYTAWVNAGKPNLRDIDPKELTERNAQNYQKDFKLWQHGKLIGVRSDPEF